MVIDLRKDNLVQDLIGNLLTMFSWTFLCSFTILSNVIILLQYGALFVLRRKVRQTHQLG